MHEFGAESLRDPAPSSRMIPARLLEIKGDVNCERWQFDRFCTTRTSV